MKHFLFFYLFLALLLGGGCIILHLSLTLIKNSFSNDKDKILFLFSFSFIVFSEIIAEYIRNVGLSINPFFLYILVISDITVFFMIYTLPRYVHGILNFPYKKLFNKVFLGFFILLSVLRLLPFSKSILSYFTNFGGILFFSAVFYSSLLLILFKGKYSEEKSSFFTTAGSTGTIIFLFLLFALNMYEKDTSVIGTIFSLNSLALTTFYICLSGGFLVNGFIELRDINKPLSQDFLPILRDNFSITERESQIIIQLIMGKSYKDISEDLFISIDTVKTHTQNIYKKLQVKNKVALANKINTLNPKRTADA